MAPILLLDEITASLYTENEHIFDERLAHFKKNKITILFTHKLSAIKKSELYISKLKMGKLKKKELIMN